MLCKEHHLNVYFQKEQLSIFDATGNPHPFLTIFIAVLGTCAEMERDSIRYRLQSGRELAKKRGVKMGRKEGSTKSIDQLKEEYAQVIKLLRRGQTIRNTAKICGVSVSTVQRVKKALLI